MLKIEKRLIALAFITLLLIPGFQNGFQNFSSKSHDQSNIIQKAFADSTREVTIPVSKDSFLRNGSPNTNEGANPNLIIQGSGEKRVVVAFDQNQISSAISPGESIASAKLRLYIVDNGNNWGTGGKTIFVHKLLSNWSEGNG